MKHVLIAEDHESANISVRKTLEDCGITHTHYVYYCDEALKQVLKRRFDDPYDLLITDLYFEEDGSVQEISGGAELIEAVRKVQPNLKVLVFSAESRAAVIDSLFNDFKIDGYVRKARRDAQELKYAIKNISENKLHFPAHLRQAIKQRNTYDFTDFDITIISLLSQGMLQKDIPAYLYEHQIKPSGLSSVEKHLNRMKEVLEFNKNEQLVAFCKDMGLI